MDGVRSTAAPVCNFQRHVSGTVVAAPSAARACAIGTPSMEATWPQIMLPSVSEPKNTVTNTASPRARTQSGRAT